jgi:hypothetical protein
LLYERLKKGRLAHLFAKAAENTPGEEADTGKEAMKTYDLLEMKGPWKYLLLVLQLCAGGLFGFSAVSLIFALFDSGGDYARYVGMMGVGVVLFALATAIQAARDADLKREILLTVKDERVNAHSHKAGFIAFWSALAMLMLFGGTASVLPIDNTNTLIMGPLVICVLAVFVYCITYSQMLRGRELKPDPVRLYFVIFALSLVPTGWMGAQWVINGLSSMGIAFFIAYAVVSAVLLVEAVIQRRIRRK